MDGQKHLRNDHVDNLPRLGGGNPRLQPGFNRMLRLQARNSFSWNNKYVRTVNFESGGNAFRKGINVEQGNITFTRQESEFSEVNRYIL